jgi:hypothetical protein
MTVEPRAWKATLDRGLGDRRTRALGTLLIALAVIGKLALLQYANIEPIFAAALIAGSVLGRWWTVIVPLAAMLILEPIEWGSLYPGYALGAIGGVTFFVITGFLFVGIAGRRLRPRVTLRVGSLALLTSISIPLTVAYDLWTDVGDWYFLLRHMGETFGTVLEMQVPFTLYHILSSLIFVPLFGTAFTFLQHHLAAARAPEEVAGEADATRAIP